MNEGVAEPAPSRIPGETHPVRRLLPDLDETTVAEQLAGLDLKPLARPEPGPDLAGVVAWRRDRIV